MRVMRALSPYLLLLGFAALRPVAIGQEPQRAAAMRAESILRSRIDTARYRRVDTMLVEPAQTGRAAFTFFIAGELDSDARRPLGPRSGDEAAIFLRSESDFLQTAGATTELRLRAIHRDPNGATHHLYDQYLAGIRVDGSDLRVHLDARGAVSAFNGDVAAIPSAAEPAAASAHVDEASIHRAVTGDLGSGAGFSVTAEKVIIADSPFVIWKADAIPTQGGERWLYEFDAFTGAMIAKADGLRTARHQMRSLPAMAPRTVVARVAFGVSARRVRVGEPFQVWAAREGNLEEIAFWLPDARGRDGLGADVLPLERCGQDPQSAGVCVGARWTTSRDGRAEVRVTPGTAGLFRVTAMAPRADPVEFVVDVHPSDSDCAVCMPFSPGPAMARVSYVFAEPKSAGGERAVSAAVVGQGIGIFQVPRNHIDTWFEDNSTPVYRLEDHSRIEGATGHTHNGRMRPGTYIRTSLFPSETVPVLDPDNIWNDPAHWPAVDAQVYSAAVYDYMLNRLELNGYDDLGSPMNLVVDYTNPAQRLDFDNAYWDGARVIIGRGSTYVSLAAALDVVGHEWGHGITDWFSRLQYRAESGALAEAFSDWFGTAVEWANGESNWTLGEGVHVFRDMANPRIFGEPDAYQGPGWVTVDGNCNATNDNCGVHTNSAVANKMFNVLVNAIGMDPAMRIALAANRNYWTPLTNFGLAASGMILAAPTVAEAEQVRNAWTAVRVPFSAFPTQPSDPTPANVATGVAINPVLAWSDSIGVQSYDVYFGTASDPPLVGNRALPTYTPGALASETVYYWRVVAKNILGATSSPVWTFTTLSIDPPGIASNPTPAPGSLDVSLDPSITWTPAPRATAHTLRFSTVSPPQPGGNPYELLPSTTYYWRVEATNAYGSTLSPIWSFTTLSLAVANDEPHLATQVVSVPVTYTQSTAAATSNTRDAIHSCTGGRDSHTVWFRYVAEFTAQLRVSTAGSDYDTVLVGNPGGYYGDTCNDNVNGTLQSEIAFDVIKGSFYFIEVSSAGQTPGGNLRLSFSRGAETCVYYLYPQTDGLGVSAITGCEWTAVPDSPWITITSGAAGTASGFVTYSTVPNPTPISRTGHILVAGHTFEIIQPGCSASASNNSGAAPGSGGSGSLTVTAAPGCTWLATVNVPWITITSGNSGSGTGTVAYSVSASNTASPRAGTIIVGTQAVTVSQAGLPGLPATPAADAVSPASGSARTMPFTFTFSDGDGASDLAVLNVLINSAIDGRASCYLAYVPSGPTAGTVFLVNDAGDAGGPFAGSLTLPGSATISNNQCAITGSGSSASMSGSALTLTLNISFTNAYTGNKVVYTGARDSGGNNSGWKTKGVWNVPGFAVPPVSVTGLAPARASSNQVTYTAQFSSTGSQLSVLNILINGGIDGRNACFLAYVVSSGFVFLVNDAGDAGGPFAGALNIPGTGTASNSQCTISGVGSSVIGNGFAITLTLNIGFSGSFSGDRVLYLAARDNAGSNSGWQAMGTLTAP